MAISGCRGTWNEPPVTIPSIDRRDFRCGPLLLRSLLLSCIIEELDKITFDLMIQRDRPSDNIGAPSLFQGAEATKYGNLPVASMTSGIYCFANIQDVAVLALAEVLVVHQDELVCCIVCKCAKEHRCIDLRASIHIRCTIERVCDVVGNIKTAREMRRTEDGSSSCSDDRETSWEGWHGSGRGRRQDESVLTPAAAFEI